MLAHVMTFGKKMWTTFKFQQKSRLTFHNENYEPHIKKKKEEKEKDKRSDPVKCIKGRGEAAACPALTPPAVTKSQRTVVGCSSLSFFLHSSVTHFLALLKNPNGESFKVRP